MVRMVTAEKTVWSGTGQCWFVLGETSVSLVFLCLCLCNRLCLCICVPLPFLNRQDNLNSEYIGFDGSPDDEHGIYAFIYVRNVRCHACTLTDSGK